MFLPISVLKDKTLYADNYFDMIRQNYPHPDDKSFEKNLTPFYFKKVGEHYISAFTIMSGLVAMPVYLLPVIANMPITLESITILAHVASALIMAFSGGVFYLLVKNKFFLNEKHSFLLTGIYLFGTVNYAMLSQALWQHGTLQLFIVIALYFLYGKKWFLSALFLGFAFITRPTAAIIIFYLALLAIYLNGKLVSAKFLLGFVPAIVFFLWYNSAFYADITNQGYASQFITGWKSRFPEGFLGIWLSPSKGILVYSPVLIFSLGGIYLAVKNWRAHVDYILFGSIIFMYTLVFGMWQHWYGGFSFGYRMASDVIPFLVLCLVPFVKSRWFEKFRQWFYGAIVFSVLVQVCGIVFFDTIWHNAYDDGYVDTAWLWSVKDSEFVFNVRRVLVKLGLLERACPQCLPGK